MKIVAKSLLIKEHIEDKVNKGCDALEIQLKSEPYDKMPNINRELLAISDIYSVHLPLGENRLDTNLDDVFSHDRIHVFNYAAKLAADAAVIWKHPVRLILHLEMDFDKLIRADYIRNHILNVFEKALSDYDNVYFAIENIIPLVPKENGFYLACNYYDDSARLVKYLRNYFDSTRFTTVLDTCHAEMSIYYMNHLMGLTEQRYNKPTMEDYFKINSPYCDTIHLCTFIRDGYFKNHGIGFTKCKDKLEEYLKLHNKYTKNAALVLELREDDYLNSINFYENSLLIKSIGYTF